MILRNFQSIAVKKILNRCEDLFLNGGNKKLIFKSPTGSGKTLMIADFLKQFSEKFGLHQENYTIRVKRSYPIILKILRAIFVLILMN